jgi:hypothetical protein
MNSIIKFVKMNIIEFKEEENNKANENKENN